MNPDPTSSSRSLTPGGKRPCPRCGALDDATDAVCLRCGASCFPEARETSHPRPSASPPAGVARLPPGWRVQWLAGGGCLVSPPFWTQAGSVAAGLLMAVVAMTVILVEESRRSAGAPVQSHGLSLGLLGVGILLGGILRACIREQWLVGPNRFEQRIVWFGFQRTRRFADASIYPQEVVQKNGDGGTWVALRLRVRDAKHEGTVACSEREILAVGAFLAEQTGWGEPSWWQGGR